MSDSKADVCFHHLSPGTWQWISSHCTACWQPPPNFSVGSVRLGWRAMLFIYFTGLSECCAANFKGAGGRTLCFLWLNCALLIPSQKSSSTQCNQSFAAMRLWWSCERSLLSARCVILLVRGVAKKTPFYRPPVGTDADKLQVCLLINDTSSAAVSVRDSCLILKTRRTLICFKSFKNLTSVYLANYKVNQLKKSFAFTSLYFLVGHLTGLHWQVRKPSEHLET